MLERPPGRPLVDQFVESTPHAEGEQIPRPRDQLGGRPPGRGPKQETGVKSRRRHPGCGEALRAVSERRLDRPFAQRFSALRCLTVRGHSGVSAESGEAPG